MSFSIWSLQGPEPYDAERVLPLRRAARLESADAHAHPQGSGGGRPEAARRWAAAAAEPPRPPRTVVRADALMSAPVRTVRADQSLGEALRLQRAAGVRHLPVVNPQGQLEGIISDRDLLAAHASPASTALVGHHMSTPVLAAAPDTRIVDVARVMLGARVGCLPIMDPDAGLVGIVTRADILRALVHELPLDLRV